MDSVQAKATPRRILVIDDVESIHADYEKILRPADPTAHEQSLHALDSLLFDAPHSPARPRSGTNAVSFELEHALQGREGYEKARDAVAEGRPFALAFVDMRMPPGWDGLETIAKIWSVDPRIQVVICTAYSDQSWADIIERLGHNDRLLLLKKPFDNAEVYQLAAALSEKWLAEGRNREAVANLERTVAERTAEISSANERLRALNAELEQSAIEAHSAARAKGRFLATMSHEIRTTLNGILGAGQMLSQGDLGESDRQFAEIITSSGEALMTIINDILDYSKFDSGQLSLEAIPFSLRRVVEDCASLLQSSARSSDAKVEIEIDPSLPAQLVGDPARVRQILLNLLNNAMKFGKGRPVRLAVKVESIADGAAQLLLSVSDQGIGMSQETVERLFTAFMQADSSTTRKFGGTGLGLAICKLLAEAMDATIHVQSRPGQGSTFSLRFALPVATGPVLPDRRDASSVDVSSAEYPGMTVLLVDDNPVNRKLARHFLKTMKLEVDFAENGEEAVERALGKAYDIVLMDLQMPRLDGYEATRRIRAGERAAHGADSSLPIVALTANAFSEVREECLQAGMNDFITKPLRMNDLKEVISRWLGPLAS